MSVQIFEKVAAAIAEVKRIDPESIRMDSTFEELRMDSLDGLDLCFKLEEAYDLTIPDDQARSLRSVRNAVEEIEKLLLERTPPESAQLG